MFHRTLLIAVAAAAAFAPELAAAPSPLTTVRVASGLNQPLFVTSPANDSRMFIVEKGGAIKIFSGGSVSTTPFLNLGPAGLNLIDQSGERGLLGLAFDPNFAGNGQLYVDYIDRVTLNTVVARYTVSPADVNLVNTASAQTILTMPQPAGRSNHKAGWIGFRPGEGGNLYIATGDGGSANDPENRAQNLSDNLGKILRVNVSGAGAGYTIPVGNPFAGATPGNDEIWAYGLRNPFRNSFDRVQDVFPEVQRQRRHRLHGPHHRAALDAGLDVTALDSPFRDDEPRVYSLHIGGEGTAEKLAAGVRSVMQSLRSSPDKSQSSPKESPAGGTLSAPAFDAIFGARGEITDQVYRIAFGREVAMPCACKTGKEMGVQSFATFFGGDDRAAVTGQIACVFGELQPVLKMLRKNGIDITAISNHLDGEAPRMIFVHYASTGRASDLAKSIKSAIDELGKRPDMHQHHD